MNTSKPPEPISPSDAAKVEAVRDEARDAANKAMPGQRAALPPGALPDGVPADPQGDENRDQPKAPDGHLVQPVKPPLTD